MHIHEATPPGVAVVAVVAVVVIVDRAEELWRTVRVYYSNISVYSGSQTHVVYSSSPPADIGCIGSRSRYIEMYCYTSYYT